MAAGKEGEAHRAIWRRKAAAIARRAVPDGSAEIRGRPSALAHRRGADRDRAPLPAAAGHAARARRCHAQGVLGRVQRQGIPGRAGARQSGRRYASQRGTDSGYHRTGLQVAARRGRAPDKAAAQPVRQDAMLDKTKGAVTASDLIARAQALVPVLASRADEAEKLRRCPDATIADYVSNGLLRVCQPKAYGGYQFGYDVLCAIIQTLAHGCASQAWTYMVL